jgi:signal transduction histidine kinase
MRERLRNVGGFLKISSTARGTTVQATVPWRESPETLAGAA